MRKRKLVVSLCVILIMTTLSWSSAVAEDNEDNLVARKMTPQKNGRYASDVEKTAAAWTGMFLTDRYAPPKNMRYVYLYAKDEQDIDMLRMRYEVGGECVTLTQTACIFQIVVTRNDPKDDMPENEREQAVQELARRLFLNGADLVLKTISKSDTRTEGHSKPQESREAAKWLDGLRWWWDDGEMGFAFIKDDGKPSAAEKGFDFELNARWFTGRTKGSKRKE